jgi:hypothetical protein
MLVEPDRIGEKIIFLIQLVASEIQMRCITNGINLLSDTEFVGCRLLGVSRSYCACLTVLHLQIKPFFKVEALNL